MPSHQTSRSLQAHRHNPVAASDPSRPTYHFRPPAGYHNDPNGLGHHAGYYHLFYQCHPFTGGRGKGDAVYWGHARSRDLVHWEHLPLALWPSTEVGEERCASGSAVIAPDGTPIVFYTSLGDRTSQAGAPDQWAAIGDPDLLTSWRYVNVLYEWPDNAVASIECPCIFRFDDRWALIFSYHPPGTGVACLVGQFDAQAGLFRTER